MRASESAHLAETFLGMLREELGHLGAVGQTLLASSESVFPQVFMCPVMSIAPLLSETTDDELWLMRVSIVTRHCALSGLVRSRFRKSAYAL